MSSAAYCISLLIVIICITSCSQSDNVNSPYGEDNIIPPTTTDLLNQLIGTYKGNCNIEIVDFDGGQYITSYDTIQTELVILRIDTNLNGSLILRTVGTFPDYFFFSPSDLENDSIQLSEHFGSHNTTLTIVQSNHTIATSSISYNALGPGWRSSNCFYVKE